MSISIIRYPGSKAKLVSQIMCRFPEQMKTLLWSSSGDLEYREPFFGAGAVGMEVMQAIHPSVNVWINDIDPSMAALWKTVRLNPRYLMRRAGEWQPTVEAFDDFKLRDGAGDDEADLAFRKIALHRMSFSGFGAMAGGPIGGKKQSSAYNVGCRWNPPELRRNIDRAHRLMSSFPQFRITCGDFAPMIEGATDKVFIYLDPPYYEKGGQLYKFNMIDADHVRLRNLLMGCDATWLLSYDDHPRIRELYADCVIEPIYATYTNAIQSGGKRPKNSEVLIYRNK